jgi:nucleoside-diphosphate-sugar epimerase
MLQAEDYERAIISPAVDMVTVVLEAAAKTPSVQRVIITSSCVTLVPFEWNFAPDSERLYTGTSTPLLNLGTSKSDTISGRHQFEPKKALW